MRRSSRRAWFVLIPTAACSSTAELDPARPEYHIIQDGEQLRVTLGTGSTLAVVHPEAAPRPFLELMFRSGAHAARSAGEEHDRTPHHTLWFSQRDLDGFDFAGSGGRNERIVAEGKPRLLGPPIPDATGVPDSTSASVECNYLWLADEGRALLRERRILSFELEQGVLYVDVHLDFMPTEESLDFMGSEEGSLALGVDPSLCLGGIRRVIQSGGRQGEAVRKKRARWIDDSVSAQGAEFGVALFDHPANLRHPAWWNERPDGTLAADPFGAHTRQGDQETLGGAILKPGFAMCLYFRLAVHDRSWDATRIETEYQRWIEAIPEPPHGEPRIRPLLDDDAPPRAR